MNTIIEKGNFARHAGICELDFVGKRLTTKIIPLTVLPYAYIIINTVYSLQTAVASLSRPAIVSLIQQCMVHACM